MPLTKEGKKVKKAMRKQYGKKKGESVFYATMNKRSRRKDWEEMRNKAIRMAGR